MSDYRELPPAVPSPDDSAVARRHGDDLRAMPVLEWTMKEEKPRPVQRVSQSALRSHAPSPRRPQIGRSLCLFGIVAQLCPLGRVDDDGRPQLRRRRGCPQRLFPRHPRHSRARFPRLFDGPLFAGPEPPRQGRRFPQLPPLWRCHGNPGDILFGDLDGVCVLPREIERETFTKALEKVRGEKRVFDAIKGGMGAQEAWKRFGIF